MTDMGVQARSGQGVSLPPGVTPGEGKDGEDGLSAAGRPQLKSAKGLCWPGHLGPEKTQTLA